MKVNGMSVVQQSLEILVFLLVLESLLACFRGTLQLVWQGNQLQSWLFHPLFKAVLSGTDFNTELSESGANIGSGPNQNRVCKQTHMAFRLSCSHVSIVFFPTRRKFLPLIIRKGREKMTN